MLRISIQYLHFKFLITVLTLSSQGCSPGWHILACQVQGFFPIYYYYLFILHPNGSLPFCLWSQSHPHKHLPFSERGGDPLGYHLILGHQIEARLHTTFPIKALQANRSFWFEAPEDRLWWCLLICAAQSIVLVSNYILFTGDHGVLGLLFGVSDVRVLVISLGCLKGIFLLCSLHTYIHFLPLLHLYINTSHRSPNCH